MDTAPPRPVYPVILIVPSLVVQVNYACAVVALMSRPASIPKAAVLNVIFIWIVYLTLPTEPANS
jgi:hypothetical protein